MEIITHSSEETKQEAIKIAKDLYPGQILALYGDLGSGKTTLTRYIVEALGFATRVQSPTFVIIRKYTKHKDTLQNNKISVINHIDLYRLTEKKEVADLGIEDLIDQKNSLTIIEWPELLEDSILKNNKVLEIYLKVIDDNTRSVNVQNLH